MIYFVDSVYGSDQNNGTSRQTAFQSLDMVNSLELRDGDSVLFKAGCVYKGQLSPKRTGSELITISRYGTGEKPLISAQRDDAVDLRDFENVIISDLAVTNPSGICGFLIRNTLGGPLKNIKVKNCDIFKINEAHEHFSYESGGIICTSFAEKPAWFENLVLEDNKITDVCRTGILVTSLWANRPKAWGRNEYVSDSEGWWPSTGLEIRGNYIDRTGGDGIVIIGTVDALIEWNTVYHVMTRPKPPCANAGIWPQSSNGCVIQYNEVGYCQKPEGCSDAQGFDVDLSCRGTLIQNNYSHDNAGGFLLLCERSDTTDADGFTGTIVRNNLSVNDGNVKGELIALVGPVRGVTIENNTLYASGNVDRIVEVWTNNGENQAAEIDFRDNIFIANGRDNSFNLANGRDFTFENNIYWGTCRNVPESHKNPVVEDPLLVNTGGGGDGMNIIKNYESQNNILKAGMKGWL